VPQVGLCRPEPAPSSHMEASFLISTMATLNRHSTTPYVATMGHVEKPDFPSPCCGG